MESQLATSDMVPSPDDMKRIIADKARELFIVCDKEEKGFVCRRDMQRLDGELPLSPEQLEEVFDSLDDDGNGFLTLEEFTDGFGGFLGLNLDPDIEDESDKAEKDVFEDEKLDDDALENDYHKVMDSLGATGIFEEQDHVKDLWKNLRKNEPELLGNLEDFIQRVCMDMRKAQLTTGELENALKTRGTAHELEVKRLYEEMELQIRAERERILHEEKEKEKRVREELTSLMRGKDEQLQELSKRQIELETKLKSLSDLEDDIKQENEMLQKTNFELRTKLDGSLMDLDESKTYLKDIQVSMKKEKRDRAHAALKVTENIMEERESLVKQLNLLRTMNKKLQDEKDEYESRLRAREAQTESQTQNAPLVKQGSVLAPYVSPARDRIKGQSRQDGVDEEEGYIIDEEDEVEVDDDVYLNGHGTPLHGVINGGLPADGVEGERMDLALGHQWRKERTEGGVDEMDGGIIKQSAQNVYSSAPENKLGAPNSAENGVGVAYKPSGLREEPVGCHSANQTMTEATRMAASPKGPERLFKVVFVGDSGVGKTSFIHRFCHDDFRPSFSATIGVDFQVKTLAINDSLVALQLWDTAGQERFRSITRHYFRKADGIIIMYDVNSENSFINVRNWMNSVVESTSESVVRMMVGNKTDMSEEGESGNRQIKEDVGKSLAESYGCLFYETSAKSGQNVKEAFHTMASILQEREDEDIEKALNLSDEPAEKGCCK
ncbi:ras and EF-hand domain-containing protein-like [Acanthaster planci]|uniref:Ras and EF-hand domain-containing protein-like n=1 Tax=Acanthaster planci TaxID=133434 RepID=A0A8B7YSX1_ACAPL|nr:ras and EF-hand domain-containing protein-like [Acanthaster planci]XP_022096394.1 ras and EF-hand domain-containing protein-like [Acanthaster planci]